MEFIDRDHDKQVIKRMRSYKSKSMSPRLRSSYESNTSSPRNESNTNSWSFVKDFLAEAMEKAGQQSNLESLLEYQF